jgi:two-component system chemotaxis response regulator CheY
MIVDDSPILRSTIRTVLERFGHHVTGEAGNSAEAYDLYRKETPDVVLLDILLPGESGLDILAEILKIDAKARVIMVTAINQSAVNEEAKQTGAKGIVYKPFEPDDLVSAIEKVME